MNSSNGTEIVSHEFITMIDTLTNNQKVPIQVATQDIQMAGIYLVNIKVLYAQSEKSCTV